MLDSDKENLKLEAMKIIVGVREEGGGREGRDGGRGEREGGGMKGQREE